MKMERYDLVIVGAGPAGLSAAVEAAKTGMKVIVFDENANPADSFSNRYISFLDPKSIKQRFVDLRLEKNYCRKPVTWVLRYS